MAIQNDHSPIQNLKAMDIYSKCLQPFVSKELEFIIAVRDSSINNKLICKHSDFIIIRSIHSDRDICFNSQCREILYALQSYFRKHNKIANYSENIFGKCLYINVSDIPLNPDFKEIFELYKINFKNRIFDIKNKYKNNTNFKKYIINNNLRYYYSFKNVNLPDTIINYIHKYLKPTFETYINYRNKIETFRSIEYSKSN